MKEYIRKYEYDLVYLIDRREHAEEEALENWNEKNTEAKSTIILALEYSVVKFGRLD